MPFRRTDREAGQILIVFVLALVAILAMAGLLFDGGRALALRRQLQNAGDAGALAAANLIQTGSPKGCGITPGSSTPRASLVTAAQDGVRASLPGFPLADIAVTCPSGWNNWAIQVNLAQRSQGYFAGVIGFNGLDVKTTSQAVNGQTVASRYSVVELDPHNPTWPNGRQGCPSVLFSGTNTITFDGSVQVNSSCPASSGGALASNGNSATITFNNGAAAFLTGGYAPGPLTITPAPQTGQPVVKDPLRNLPPMAYTSWASTLTRATSRTTVSGGVRIFEPGVYIGGIELRNTAIAFMRPGIYVMKNAANGDGGLEIGSQAKMYSVPALLSVTTDLTWPTDCTASNCGVMIYNVGMACASGNPRDDITVGAGATLKLRPYNPGADGTGTNDPAYQNLLIWQDANPVPTSSCSQPTISLSGGGQVVVSGGVYSPSATVQMGGNSGGSGGSTLDLTLQFISWNLQFSGNIGFHFIYQDNSFPMPLDYGLVR